MDMISSLSDPGLWQEYFEYKRGSGRLLNREEQELSVFIGQQKYLPIVEHIQNGGTFPPPKKSAISKMNSAKKRIVYTYPPAENQVLKLLTYLMLRKYDGCFSDNLYSFRAGRTPKDAIRRLTCHPRISQMWSYKADISNYFNSIPVRKLLPLLERTLSAEPELYRFLASLLTNPLVSDNGKLVSEEKGIMAGTPISTFLANLYLSELDAHFAAEGIVYARYSDDIIVFAPTREELEGQVDFICRILSDAGLSINPSKESRTAPGEMWVFLGFSCHNGRIDIAPASLQKLKAKMRRKSRALARWRDRKNAPGENAAKAFIRAFNRKLFEGVPEHNLTWARWYFPVITTTESLKLIDAYAQSCIRTLATGKHTKAAYQFRYEDMKKLGYVTLVGSYYSHWTTENEMDRTKKTVNFCCKSRSDGL